MITLDDIRQAQARLRGVARHTPLIPFEGAYLKPESFQPIGSFKVRGAYNRIAALPPEQRALGVITYSSGNHAQGVAFSAQQLGISALVVMPNNAPAVKIEATRSYGAEVVLYDPALEKREEVTQRLMQGQTLVPPFDDPFVIAGQGTIGAEIAADFAEVELVLVPVGGGGLISGVSTALKNLIPGVKVMGVEPQMAADAQQSLRAGHVVSLSAADVGRTVADGVRTLSVSELTFAHMQHYIDGIITVSEDEIRAATRRLILGAKLVIEPSGALPLAAWLYHRAELPPATRVALVLSGGNIEPSFLAEIVKG